MSPSRLYAIAASLLVVCALRTGIHLVESAVEAGRRLVVLDAEGRRRLVYGDCDVRGYGYIRRVTDGIPRERGLPRVRAVDEAWPSDLVLPENDWDREARVVIGIGFDEKGFAERLAAADGPSYRIVHRSDRCFTAIAPGILREGEVDGSPWHAWLARLSGVR